MQEQKNSGSWVTVFSNRPTYVTYYITNRTTGSYKYRVKVSTAGGGSCCSAYTTSNTIAVTVAPGAPHSLTSTGTNGSYTLTWGASTGNLDGYQLQQRFVGGSWQQIYQGSSLSKAVTLGDGDYEFKVRAYSGTTYSSYTPSYSLNVETERDYSEKGSVTIADSPLVSPSVPANQNIGDLGGSAGVSGGSASYSIPIKIAPGRAGMQPNISLSYSSSGGNGVAGVGWSLSAAGGVSRCSSTLAQDGVSRAVHLDGADKLCLNGQRLILLSGTYGISGAHYRTELDSFDEVIQSGNLSSAGVSFTVNTKAGGIDTYGTYSDWRVSSSGVSVEQSWLLHRSVDTIGTNNINYYYSQKGDGEVVIEDIWYTGNGSSNGDRLVHFDYEVRPDHTSSYHMGGLTRNRYRLTNITNTISGQTQWQYNLTYKTTNSTVSDRSLLTAVELCGMNGQCLPETEFNWRNQNLSATYEPMSYDGTMLYPGIQDIFAYLPHGDVNADGVRDWKGFFVNAEGNYAGVNNSDVFPCYRRTARSQPVCVDADVNRDGRTDDWRRSSGGYLQIKYTGETNWRTTSVTLDQVTNSSGLEDGHVKNIADYNGDSWPDLMVYRDNNSSPRLYLYLHSGNINAPYNTSGQLIYQYSATGLTPKKLQNGIQFQGDLDGNGRPDLVEIDTGNGNNEFYPQPRPVNLLLNQLGTSVVFQTQAFNYALLSANNDVYFSQFIDINGDGLTDWLGWKAASGQQAHQLIARYNIGDGNFGTEKIVSGDSMITRINYADAGDGESYIETKYVRYSQAFKTADINGDGRPEILTPGYRWKEACALISTNNNPPTARCGEALYGERYASASLGSLVSIDSASVDDSIYRFDALYFDEDSNGNLSLRRETTPFYGHAYQSVMADAFGKGLQDLISLYRAPGAGFTQTQSTNYGVYISRNKGQPASGEAYGAIDLMESVTNGLGVNSSWDYRPLSTGTYSSGSDPFYDPDMAYTGQFTPGNGEYLHFSSSMYNVAEFTQDDGIGGENSTLYRYRAAVYNTQGRGFQGFRTIIVDEPSGIRTVTDFDQKFPLAGKVESV